MRPVPHLVRANTNFQEATVLRSAEDISRPMLEFCDTLHTGFRTVVTIDQEAFMASEVFHILAETSGVVLQTSRHRIA